MKIIKNKDDAACMTCFVGSHAVLTENAEVVCNHCGSEDLISRKTQAAFSPVFGAYERVYQASFYTPKLKDRRGPKRPWPKMKERRAAA